MGDTLYSIARQYETTVDELKRINNLTNNVLNIGQVLKIPNNNGNNNDNNNGNNNENITYIVVSGDSLYSIVRKYNTTIDELKRINNLTSNNLSIGQILKVPTTNSSGDSTITYVVVSGDNLYDIARRYNTSVDAIKTLNNLTSNNLSIGQVLKIPSSTTSSTYFDYVVVSGDSLYSIARKYNTTVDEIKSINNLKNNSLSIGQILRIPK